MEAKANLPPPSPDDDESTGLHIDPMEIVWFVVGAARRNLWTCVSVGVLVAAIGLAIISALPRKYQSTCKIYASNVGALTAQLTSGRRSIGDEAALKDIYESVYNYANISSLMRQAKLVENWPATRNWFQRIIDRVRIALHGPTSTEDMEQMLSSMLEGMIEVHTEDNASIRFRATWRDPTSAMKLTQLMQQNYVSAKETEEVSAIQRAAAVLEDELKQADAAFAPAVTELRDEITKLREQAKSKLTPQPTAAPRPTPAAPSVELPRSSGPPVELTAKLEELRNEERAILEPWQRRNADLKFQLTDLLAVYGPAHPSVVQLENKLKAAAAEPVELLDIRQREAELKQSITNWAVTGRASVGGITHLAASQGNRASAEQDLLRELVANTADDPRLAPARMRLESVLHKSTEMQGRLDEARMALAIAQVGFKYRYREIEPARFWAKPIAPKFPMLYTAVVAATLILGFLAGAGKELVMGRVMEAWQLKQLGVTVLARVNVGAWRDSDRDE